MLYHCGLSDAVFLMEKRKLTIKAMNSPTVPFSYRGIFCNRQRAESNMTHQCNRTWISFLSSTDHWVEKRMKSNWSSLESHSYRLLACLLFFYFPPVSIHIFTLPCRLSAPTLYTPPQLIVKVLVSVMLKCTSLQRKPPSDMESILSKGLYTTDWKYQTNVSVWRGITATKSVVHSGFRLFPSCTSLYSTQQTVSQLSNSKTRHSLSPSQTNRINSHFHSNSNFIPGIRRTNSTTLLDSLKMPTYFLHKLLPVIPIN